MPFGVTTSFAKFFQSVGESRFGDSLLVPSVCLDSDLCRAPYWDVGVAGSPVGSVKPRSGELVLDRLPSPKPFLRLVTFLTSRLAVTAPGGDEGLSIREMPADMSLIIGRRVPRSAEALFDLDGRVLEGYTGIVKP